jgi:hypothetical protein
VQAVLCVTTGFATCPVATWWCLVVSGTAAADMDRAVTDQAGAAAMLMVTGGAHQQLCLSCAIQCDEDQWCVPGSKHRANPSTA